MDTFGELLAKKSEIEWDEDDESYEPESDL